MEDQNGNDFNSFLNIGEKGSDTLVFQFGSHSVKFGLASQLQPFVIPNCIAYRLIENDDEYDQMDIDIEINIKNEESNDTFLSNLVSMEQDVIKKLMKLEQRQKGKNKLIIPNKNIKVKY
jgi:actin-related protein